MVSPQVRAERTSDKGLSVPALNAFSIDIGKQPEAASRAEKEFMLEYAVAEDSGMREVLEE